MQHLQTLNSIIILPPNTDRGAYWSCHAEHPFGSHTPQNGETAYFGTN
jgi:hypothetical protein